MIVSMDTYQFEQFMLFQTFLPVIIGLFLLGTVIYGVFVIWRPQLNPATKNNTEVPVGMPGPQGRREPQMRKGPLMPRLFATGKPRQ